MEDFKTIKEFRIDTLSFQLLKNENGEYKTICTPEVGEATEQIYKDFEQLYECFEDEFSREELLS